MHERLQQRARQAGPSLQAYMRQWVADRTRSEDRRAAVLAELEDTMRRDGGSGVTAQQILDDLDDDSRR